MCSYTHRKTDKGVVEKEEKEWSKMGEVDTDILKGIRQMVGLTQVLS